MHVTDSAPATNKGIMEHTKLPFHLDESEGQYPDDKVYHICTSDKWSDIIIATVRQDKEMAAFIVKACNSHYELLEACNKLIDFQQRYDKETGDTFPGNDFWGNQGMNAVDMAKAAIAKAE